MVFLKEAVERLLHVPELSQESKAHTTHGCSHNLPVRLKAWSDVGVPLNSVHVCFYLPLLLCVSLRGLDSFQVGQQQTSFLQNVTDIVLKQHKKKTNREKTKKWETEIRERQRGGRERRAGYNLHLSVSVCVRVQQELDGAGFVWKFGLGQFWSEALQQLGDLLHCHSKSLDGLETTKQQQTGTYHTHTQNLFKTKDERFRCKDSTPDTHRTRFWSRSSVMPFIYLHSCLSARLQQLEVEMEIWTDVWCFCYVTWVNLWIVGLNIVGKIWDIKQRLRPVWRPG